jgi:hypothetical protein
MVLDMREETDNITELTFIWTVPALDMSAPELLDTL